MFRISSSNKRRSRTSKGNYSFRRKRKSPRIEVHRLDLNPETDASRRALLRKRAGTGARWAFGLLSCIVFFALLKVVAMEAFVTNERFLIKHINVITKGPLSVSSLTAFSGLKTGENLLMISLRSVRDKLEALPEVRSAVVTREFSGVITLEVQQRTPVAWLECPEKSIAAKVAGYGCLLDDEGVILPSVKHAASEQKLPIITIENLPRIAPGKRVESPAALAALKLIQTYSQTHLSERHHLDKVDATRPHALVARFSPGIRVTFPSDDNISAQLTRFQLTLEAAARRNLQVESVNLLVEHNVPVTVRGTPTAVPTSAPGKRPLTASR